MIEVSIEFICCEYNVNGHMYWMNPDLQPTTWVSSMCSCMEFCTICVLPATFAMIILIMLLFPQIPCFWHQFLLRWVRRGNFLLFARIELLCFTVFGLVWQRRHWRIKQQHYLVTSGYGPSLLFSGKAEIAWKLCSLEQGQKTSTP